MVQKMTKIDARDSQQVYDRDAKDFADKAPSLLTYEFIGKPFILESLRRFVTVNPDTKALDVGSASGRIVELLISQGIKANNIMGVEISPNEVDIAKKRIPEAIFQVGDIVTFKLPSDTFDVVTSYMVWEFLDRDRLDKAFSNLNASMKPGGVLIYGTTHPGRYVGKYGVKDEGWVNTGGPWGGSFDNWYRTVEQFISQTEQAGFTIDQVQELDMPIEAAHAYPDRIKEFNSFGAPVRLTVVAHKR